MSTFKTVCAAVSAGLVGLLGSLLGSLLVVPMSGFFVVLLVIAVIAWLVFRRR
jgi:hypothetical protein